MEVAGLALGLVGAVGVLGQLFDGCITGYRVFSTARDLGKDSERLICKIRIEEMRLVVWGREWGVTEGKFEAHLSASPHDGLKDMAKEILSQLLSTILDCHKLQNKYGLREEAPGSVDRQAYSECKEVAEPANPRSSPSKRGIRLRAKWVVADKDKFTSLLTDLEYFNDRLEKLFPSTSVTTLQRAWTNELLETAQRDLANLALLEKAAGGRYPGLQAMAQLKQLRVNLDAKEPSKKILSSSELKIPRWRIKVNEDKAAESRHVRAVFQKPVDSMQGGSVSEDVPVLVDWIEYEPDMEMDARLHLYQRIDNLARMLYECSSRHPDLHTLDCAGYCEDTAKNRYGIIHHIPAPSPSASPLLLPSPSSSEPLPLTTLSSAMDDSTKRTPDLDVRFRLAHQLAVALWSIHSLDWLHKSFCAHNIVFFPSPPTEPATRASINGSGTNTPGRKSPATPPRPNTPSSSAPEQHDLRTPYLIGFDSSRPDGLIEMTSAPPTLSPATPASAAASAAIYRHPASLGVWRQPYRKAFDVYSLGLVLLELGLWKSVRAVHRPRYSNAAFRDKILAGLVPALGSKTGRRYRELVEECLRFEDGEGGGAREEVEAPGKEGRTAHQMMEHVVLTLESLKV